MMTTVTIEEITEENWLQAMALRVHPQQERFVPSVAYSLARAYVRPEGMPVAPFAIYADEQIVGFFTVTYDADSTQMYWLGDFIIGKQHQRRGYGRAALVEIVKMLHENCPRCMRVGLTILPENVAARRFYEEFGFVDSGERQEGEYIYYLDLVPHYSESSIDLSPGIHEEKDDG